VTVCETCKIRTASIGIIIGDKYHNVCAECKPLPRVSSGHARWSRGIDIEDREADVQQPYNKDGSINTRFAKLYPKQAKALFSDDDIRKANLR